MPLICVGCSKRDTEECKNCPHYNELDPIYYL